MTSRNFLKELQTIPGWYEMATGEIRRCNPTYSSLECPITAVANLHLSASRAPYLLCHFYPAGLHLGLSKDFIMEVVRAGDKQDMQRSHISLRKQLEKACKINKKRKNHDSKTIS